MQSQPPSQPVRGNRRSSAAAKSRVCVHCGRSFRRTEHLERHVRTHTKEKPYICFCGAAFTRRDLLKRHTNIAHPGNGLVSPNSQPETESVEPQPHPRPSEPAPVPPAPPAPVPVPVPVPVPAAAAAAAPPGFIVPPPTSRPDAPLSVPPNVEQWTGPPPPPPQPQPQQQPPRESYITPDRAPVLEPVNHAPPSIPPHSGVLGHDAEVLEAAQLLLPGNYRHTPTPAQPMPYLPEELNHFQDFTHFLDSIGLPSEWVPAFGEVPQMHNPVPATTVPDIDRNHTLQQDAPRRSIPERSSRGDSPFRSWLPSVPPEDQSLGSVHDYEPPQNARSSSSLKVTEEQRQRLAAALEEFRYLIPDFVLPSRHTLTRYLTSFFDGFHTHLPFMHAPTFRINDRAPELVLAFMTLGAQYRFEHRNAERLFHASKEIVLCRLSKESHGMPYNTIVQIPLNHIRDPALPSQASPLPPAEFATGMSAWRQLETIRTLLALMGYSTWEKAELVQEAFGLQNLLVRCLRSLVWQRTSLLLQDTALCNGTTYNIYPVLRSSEVHLRLPCSTKEWNAATAHEWEAAQKEVGSQQLFFQDALALLLQPARHPVPLEPIPAPLGNYILLHGLLQRIHLVSELSIPNGDHSFSLPTEELNKLERALRTWTSVWQQAPESSLDPHNENGPIPFTSSSFLGLAYVRLSLNLGAYRQLETRDPYRIAAALHRSPRPSRSYQLTPALIYAAHALSVPVRLGIDHVARSQAFFWSVRHSIASLECAVLLSKWLLSLAETGGTQSLSGNESRILHWTRCIVQEAYDSLDLDKDETFPGLDPTSLGLAVIQLWARLFRKNTQWPFINVMGESLEKYLDLIRPE